MAAQRLFVGLPLPQSYQLGLAGLRSALARSLSGKFSWTEPGNWHLTLKFLGDTPEVRVGAVQEALAGISFAKVALRAAGGGFFPSAVRPRVIWVGLGLGRGACADLAAGIEAAVTPLGIPPEDRAFSAHLTVGRVKSAKPGQDWNKALEIMLKAEWEDIVVDRFVLWRSILGGASRPGGPPGPEYLPLGEYPASGQAAELSGLGRANG